MSELTCSEPGCGKPVVARGQCNAHYLKAKRQAKRQGIPMPPLEPLHWLSNVDADAKLADCAICGPQVTIRLRVRTIENRIKQEGQCATVAKTRRRRNDHETPASRIEHNRKQRYRLTRADYDRMFGEQGGRCLICLTGHPRLFVDHDHETGAVRGLLCHRCNVGIGWLQDRVDVIERAAQYLRERKASAA